MHPNVQRCTPLTQTQIQTNISSTRNFISDFDFHSLLSFCYLFAISFLKKRRKKNYTNQTVKKIPTKIESQFHVNFIIQIALTIKSQNYWKLEKKSILNKRREWENVIFSIFNKTKIFRFFFCVRLFFFFFPQWLAFRNSNVATNKQTSNGSCLSFTLRCIHAQNTFFSCCCYTIALMRICTHSNSFYFSLIYFNKI